MSNLGEESFEERTRRWQHTFEDILIEMEQERTANGLLLGIDIGNLVPEMQKAIDSVIKSKVYADKNPNKATIIPGNPLNYE